MNCDVYCIFRASAFSLESLLVTLSGLRKGMLHTFSSLLLFYIGVYILGSFCYVDVQDVVDVASVEPLQCNFDLVVEF